MKDNGENLKVLKPFAACGTLGCGSVHHWVDLAGLKAGLDDLRGLSGLQGFWLYESKAALACELNCSAYTTHTAKNISIGQLLLWELLWC